MNKQGIKGIEWTDWTWNVVTGCLHNCWYCYAKKLFTRFHKSFEPTFYPERLGELKKLKKPAKIFVCSVADLFATWTKPEWTQRVLDEIRKPKYNYLTFQLLTKNPENIHNFLLNPTSNIWIGTTITCQEEMKNISALVDNWKGIKFLSFEPLLEEIKVRKSYFSPVQYNFQCIDWVIIGKLTGSKKVKLEPEWVKKIISECREQSIPIFLKNNLNWSEKIQEFPNY